MTTEVVGVDWIVTNGEISEAHKFAVRPRGTDPNSDRAFPIEWLSDAINVLTSQQGAGYGTVVRGTYFQSRKLSLFHSDIEFGLLDGVGYELRFYETYLTDLVNTLSAFQAALAGLEKEDWDHSDLEFGRAAVDSVRSTTVTEIVVSEDPDYPISDGTLLIVVPTGTIEPDTIAPSVPTGVDATATSTTNILLSWSASTDNIAVAGYEYRIDNGSAVDAGTGTSEDIGGLDAATTYTFHVRAYDAAGNRSGWSSAAVETTDSTPSTTFQTDYAGMTAEVAPTGHTSRWAAFTTNLVKDDGAVSSGKLLKLKAQASSSRAALSFDAAGSRADVEILARWRPPVSNAGGGRLLARGSGSSGSETAILGYVSSTGFPTIGTYNAGTPLTVATAGTGIGAPVVGNWYRIRMRVIGDTVQLRAWAESGSEPGTWNVTATGVAGPLVAGWMGVMAFNGAETDYDWISVGWDGATAPSVS